jgi:hypothetical protein
VELRLDEGNLERAPDRAVFEARLGRTVLVLVLLALGLALSVLPASAGGAGWAVALLIGLPLLGLSALLLPGALRGLRGRWWIVRIAPDGLALRLRSYLNSDLPADEPTVLWIEAGEVACVRARAGHVAAGRAARSAAVQRLEIELRAEVPADVAAALAREAAPRARRRAHYGALPLAQRGARRLDLCVLGPTFALSARLGTLARWLREAGWSVEDGPPIEPPDASSLEDPVDRALAVGDRMGAMRVLRQRTNLSLTEARTELDERTRRLSA